MNILTVIPARGGSKGILKKNLQTVCGETLLSHALNCAWHSKFEADIIVSTDSIEIIEHAKSLGYKGCYMRPESLAQDDSRIVDAVLDVYCWACTNNGKNYDVIVVLQPTSPLRVSKDLDGALECFFADADSSSLISVNKMQEHPFECVTTGPDGWHYLVASEVEHTGRQSYDQNYFFINGAIYICNSEHLIQSNKLIDYNSSILYEMPRSRSIDIDTAEDLIIANALCENDNSS